MFGKAVRGVQRIFKLQGADGGAPSSLMEVPPDLLARTLQAVAATRKPDANNAELNALGQLFEQLKSADAHSVATLASQMVAENLPLEAQHFGFQLLQHLVTYRWNEFEETDHDMLGSMAFTLLVSTGNTSSWAVRSKAALLLALMTKRRGHKFWQNLLPELISYASQGPLQAEKVCMVLRLVTEEVTWTNDGNAGPEIVQWRREMLASLTASLDLILPFLHSVLELNYGRALDTGLAGDVAAAHAATVTAALAAIREFTEWAPLGRMASAKIISACAFLVGTKEFRAEACEVLRSLAARRLAQEDPALFAPAIGEAGEALIRAAEHVLAPENAGELGLGGDLEDFAQYVCISMGIWGYNHISSIPENRRLHFLELNLAFLRNDYMLLAHKALPLWVSLLGTAERNLRGCKQESQIPHECAAVLMDLAGEKMQRGVHLEKESDEFPEPFESFEEYHSFLLEYRDLLSRIVRLTASILPEQALQAAMRRLQHAIGVCSTSGQTTEAQRHVFEATTFFVESVVGPVSSGFLPGGRRMPNTVVNVSPDTVGSILDALESMFRALLGLHFSDPVLVTCLCRLMEAFERLIELRKDLAIPAIEKVFDMFNDLPMEGGPWNLPADPPPGWKERFQARTKIPGVLVTYAKLASAGMRPHVEALAVKTDECWRARSISPGERAALCDMMVASASSADISFQQQVVEHVLRSTKEEWESPGWQALLSCPATFVAHFCPPVTSPSGIFEIGGGFQRWMVAHHLQLVERAVRRLPGSADLGAEGCMSPQSPAWHVLNPHLSWMLPSLLQIIITLQSLSTPQGASLLGPAAAALQMGPRERAIYLRQLTKSKQISDAEIQEEEKATIAGNSVPALRSWMRVMREGLCQTLGLLLRSVGGCYSQHALQPQFVGAITGCLETLHASHVRMLIRHIVIPLVKVCPEHHRRAWVLPVLSELLPHVHRRLTSGWEALLKSSGKFGAAAARMGANTLEKSSAANEEIIQERLLRELTAEHLILLRMTQDAPLLEDGKAQQSVLELTWRELPHAAMAACWTAAAALWWPDDVTTRASAFLRGVLLVASRQALEEFSGNIMRGCLEAIANGQPGPSSEVLGLARDVLTIQPPLQGPRLELLTLPLVSEEKVNSFDKELFETNSETKQRLVVKTLFIDSGTAAKFKQTNMYVLEKAVKFKDISSGIQGSEELQVALSDWRPVSGVSNMADPKNRQHRHIPLPADDALPDSSALVGLAAVNGH